jgi:hypothetical protein
MEDLKSVSHCHLLHCHWRSYGTVKCTVSRGVTVYSRMTMGGRHSRGELLSSDIACRTYCTRCRNVDDSDSGPHLRSTAMNRSENKYKFVNKHNKNLLTNIHTINKHIRIYSLDFVHLIIRTLVLISNSECIARRAVDRTYHSRFIPKRVAEASQIFL